MGQSLGNALTELVVDPTPLAMVLLASLTVHASTWRACWDPRSRPRRVNDPSGHSIAGTGSRSAQDDALDLSELLSGPYVLLIPLSVALMLLVLFWFGDILGPLLIIVASVIGVVAISFVLWPIGAKLGVGVSSLRALLAVVASMIVTYWLLTGNWVASDTIAMCLCITAASAVRVPSLKSVTFLSVGLVVYDVIMVFATPYLSKSGKSVMVEVATSEPQNPVALLSDALHLPSPAALKLGFPGKLVLPILAKDSQGGFAILGLGDCLVPAILFVYLRSMERRPELDPQRKRGLSYYWCGLAAYAASVLLSYLCNVMSGVAQPALMYIVPGTLVTTFVTSRQNGETKFLWDPQANLGEAPAVTERLLPSDAMESP